MRKFIFMFLALGLVLMPVLAEGGIKVSSAKSDTLIGDDAVTTPDIRVRVESFSKDEVSVMVIADVETYGTDGADSVMVQGRLSIDAETWTIWTTIDTILTAGTTVNYLMDLKDAQTEFQLSGSATATTAGVAASRYIELRGKLAGDEVATDTVKVTFKTMTVKD